jgi:hypothetical protein
MRCSNKFLMLEEALMPPDQFEAFEVLRFANANQIDKICTRIEDSHSFSIGVGVPDSALPSLCRAYQSDGSLNFVFCSKTGGYEGQEPRGVAETRTMPRVFVTESMSLSNRKAWSA